MPVLLLSSVSCPGNRGRYVWRVEPAGRPSKSSGWQTISLSNYIRPYRSISADWLPDAVQLNWLMRLIDHPLRKLEAIG